MSQKDHSVFLCQCSPEGVAVLAQGDRVNCFPWGHNSKTRCAANPQLRTIHKSGCVHLLDWQEIANSWIRESVETGAEAAQVPQSEEPQGYGEEES